MIKSCWTEFVEGRSLPQTRDIWETAQVCIDKSVAPSRRTMIVTERLFASTQFIEGRGASGIIGVTRAHLLSRLVREGIERLDRAALVEDVTERAFFVFAQCFRSVHHCRKCAIRKSVLAEAPFGVRRIAA